MSVVSYTKARIDTLLAAAKDRANHTGTQAANTITGLAAVATSGAYPDLSDKPTLGAGVLLDSDSVPYYDPAAVSGGGGGASGPSWTVPPTAWHIGYAGSNTTHGPQGAYQQFYPFVLPANLSTATLRMEVTAAIAGSSVQMGVYLGDAATGLPDFATLIPFGTFDSATTGIKDLARALVTLPGNKVLWLTELATSGSTPTLRAVTVPASGHPGLPLPAGVNPPAAAAAFGLISINGGMSALATSPITLGTTPIACPRFSLRNDSA